jgi:outer membrane lipoprotein-sorting protein
LTSTVAFLTTGWLAPSTPSAAEDVLARSRAVYASLRSYADTGTMIYEYGPRGAVLADHHTFKTSYRAPRNFYFEFNKDAGTDRFVVWSDGPAFHTWWAATGVTDTYPPGRGTDAFAIGAVPTSNTITNIPPLLFSTAGLTGTLTELRDASVAGTEVIDGHQCQKITGIAKSTYAATGNEVNVRKVIVWLDTDTALVRRIFEDSSGVPAGNTSRSTVTFEPRANPTLEDAKFRFTPPKGNQ